MRSDASSHLRSCRIRCPDVGIFLSGNCADALVVLCWFSFSLLLFVIVVVVLLVTMLVSHVAI